MTQDVSPRSVDDILERLWDEIDPDDWEVASFRSDYGVTIIGVAEVEGWLIPFSAGDDTGYCTLGTWRFDEPSARTAALKACLGECGPWLGFWIGPELRGVSEVDGQAPWMNGDLIDLLTSYEAGALAEALEDDSEVHVIDNAPDVIRRLQQGLAPTTDDERSFAWDLASALGTARHQGRRIGD
jgi:hypothetical protein